MYLSMSGRLPMPIRLFTLQGLFLQLRFRTILLLHLFSHILLRHDLGADLTLGNNLFVVLAAALDLIRLHSIDPLPLNLISA